MTHSEPILTPLCKSHETLGNQTTTVDISNYKFLSWVAPIPGSHPFTCFTVPAAGI
jgi:hypothetical protein